MSEFFTSEFKTRKNLKGIKFMVKFDIRKNKILHIFAVALSVFVIIILFLSLSNVLIAGVREHIVSSNIESMKELSLHDENSIKNSILFRYDVMEGAAKRMNKRNWQSIDELLAAANDLTNNVPSVDKIALLDSSSTAYFSTGLIQEDSYLADVCDGEPGRVIGRVITDPLFHDTMDELLIMAVPVSFTVKDVNIEYLVCQFLVSSLEDELKITSYDRKGFSSVIDKDGNYLINISDNHSLGDNDNIFDELRTAEFENYENFDAFLSDVPAQGAASAVYENNGQEQIIVVTSFDFADWYFVTIVPTSVFSTQSRAILELFFTFFIIAAIIILVVITVLILQIRKTTQLRIEEATNKSKTEFLFNMSHDIRTPMNAILGYADIGLKNIDDKDISQNSFGKIKLAGKHLISIINDILEMSRIEAGKLELKNAPLNLRDAINTVEQMISSLADAKNIDFKTDTTDITDAYVYSDELHLNQVFINLLSNAVKYTPEGGKVVYSAHQQSGVKDKRATYIFKVSDNGIGMSDDYKQHLFEAFSRDSVREVSSVEGTGLGLSIVKRIVDLAGGKIDVESKQGEGTTFTVYLTFDVLDENEIARFVAENTLPDKSKSSNVFAGKRVLVVDDNEMNLEITQDILTDSGFLVESARNGEIAVDAIRSKEKSYYDIILMDIQMPVMNGYEAAKAIRNLENGTALPIIALSANTYEEDKELSLSCGMNDHIGKPIDPAILLDTIEKYI